MPRLPRQKSESGIYHIMLRGTNKQVIFHDDEDHIKFLEILGRCKNKAKIELYAWCLMNNHLHLLLKEGVEELAITMKRVGVSYAWHYNFKYRTVGHLFQDRYKSENVESDEYFITVIRYIHQNPVKAGIVERPSLWEWSSCREYYYIDTYPINLVDRDVLFRMFSEDKKGALEKFKEFNEQKNEDNFLDDNISLKLTDEEAKQEITKRIPWVEIIEIKNLPKSQRDEIIKKVNDINGISQRQMARILGLSQALVSITCRNQ